MPIQNSDPEKEALSALNDVEAACDVIRKHITAGRAKKAAEVAAKVRAVLDVLVNDTLKDLDLISGQDG